jgi:hypothetical protein
MIDPWLPGGGSQYLGPMCAGVPDRLRPRFHVVDLPIAATLEILVIIIISSFYEQHAVYAK